MFIQIRQQDVMSNVILLAQEQGRLLVENVMNKLIQTRFIPFSHQ